MLTQTLLSFALGATLPTSHPAYGELVQYKERHLSRGEISNCERTAVTPFFDISLNCTNADFITFYLDSVLGDSAQTHIDMPDDQHVYRMHVMDGASLATIANQSGQIFFAKFNLQKTTFTFQDIEQARRQLTDAIGLPVNKDLTRNYIYQWKTTDRFDVSLKERAYDFELTFIDQMSYQAVNHIHHLLF